MYDTSSGGGDAGSVREASRTGDRQEQITSEGGGGGVGDKGGEQWRGSREKSDDGVHVRFTLYKLVCNCTK